MGIFSRFEDRMEDTVEGAASRMSKAPISPVQIAKKAEKQMRRETMVGAGKQYAPTLYTVLVNADDDSRLFGYYPTLAGETETYLSAKAAENGLVMDGNPLVRFIADEGLRHGKFEVIAEVVAAPIIEELRAEEMERYGIAAKPQEGRRPQQAQQQAYQGAYGYEQPRREAYGYNQPQQNGYGYGQPEVEQQQPPRNKPPLPYVPEEEIDRSIDYGEYTFNSEDFEDYRNTADDPDNAPMAYNDAYQEQEAYPAAHDNEYAQPIETDIPEDEWRSNDAPQGQGRPQQIQAPSTVAFAGGTGEAGKGIPDHTVVRARLVDRRYQRPYDLAGTRITIGRESSNDIVVQDINASRRHAELILNQQGLWVITDLSSMNGTFVNGISIATQPLYPGDIVTVGKTELEFVLA